MRLIKSFTREEALRPVRVANVYFHADWEEYTVRFYINGVHQRKADYHADDKQDAIETADFWTNREN